MKKILTSTACLWLFIQCIATAQESTPIPTMTGTVSSFIDGDSISIDVSSTDHRTFHVTRMVEVIGADGNGASVGAITTGSSVTLHFIQDYNDLIVDRVLLTQ